MSLLSTEILNPAVLNSRDLHKQSDKYVQQQNSEVKLEEDSKIKRGKEDVEEIKECSDNEDRFPPVSKKPGYHRMMHSDQDNCNDIYNLPETTETASETEEKEMSDTKEEIDFETLSTEIQDNNNDANNKSRTLSKMFRHLSRGGPNAKQNMAKNEDEPEMKADSSKVEKPEEKSSGIGKVLNRMNTMSKESCTNISKAFHRISGALTSGSKHSQKEEKVDGEQSQKPTKSGETLSYKEKYSSLGRKLSNMGSHFSKFNHQRGESTLETKVDHHQSEAKFEEPNHNPVKQCPSEKSSTLGRKLSNLGSHFRVKGIQDTGSGEVVSLGDTKLEEKKTIGDVKKEIG